MWIGPEDHKIVGTFLEAVRQSADVTQTELAKRLRKPQSFISSYENGQRRLDLLELVKIVLALGGDPVTVCSDIVKEIVSARKNAKPGKAGVSRSTKK